MTDKLNPKIPITIGIILTFFSMYLYSKLSLYTEYGDIMLPLVIRGFGLGFMFIPLSTLAINDISKEKMAQATGMFNTIRQVGGSFGVAILGSLLTQRVNYHSAMFGEALNPASATFQNTVYGLKHFVQQSLGGSGAELTMRAKSMIIQHVVNQAFIQGIADDFLVGSAITLLIAIPLFFLKYKKKRDNAKIESVE
jgi:DHA2 family multidrug resistance protein